MNGHAWRGVMAVAQFEGRRSMSLSRFGLWMVLAGFPVAIVTLIYFATRDRLSSTPNDVHVWEFVIFALTQVTVALSALLWAAPSLQVELENRTWIYSATRPYGRRSVLLGRYAVAVLWAMSVGCASVIVCSLIAGTFRAIPALLVATTLGGAGFSAMFSLLAVLFPKRAISVAFAVAMIFEFGIALIPAVIHELTIEYHLRCLLGNWLWEGTQFRTELMFSNASSLRHILSLLVYVGVVLTIAVVTLEGKEVPTDEL